MNTLILILIAALSTGFPGVLSAQPKPADLAGATLEELLNMEVTSAGRRQQRAEDVAAAVYVITRDDIRRSGLTVLPEILRLAPGVQVAQVNANKWAVSVRGFNDLYSNKLLILVDGRSLYNRSFSGVFWDAQDLDITDIERIEIVRGPGGAIWGANAVNGIINIITRSAHLTTGASASVAIGTFEHGRASLRYGGLRGRTSYRIFGRWSGYGEGLTVGGDPAGDQWQSLTGGYRLDWSNETDTVMAQGHYTTGENRPRFLALEQFAPDVFTSAGVSKTNELSVLGRWTRTIESGALLQAQAYTTHTTRDEYSIHAVERTSDLEVQYEQPIGGHVLVAGGGYRHIDLATRGSVALGIAPERAQVFNAFVQDEIALPGRVMLTVGARIERETYAGWGVSPSVRAIWEASSQQRLWAALSRARRTPAAIERSLRYNLSSFPGDPLPVLIAVTGNAEYDTELLTQVEVGYRRRIGAAVALDLTVFRGHYQGIPTLEPQAPVFEPTPVPAHVLVAWKYSNLLNVASEGVELAMHWTPFDVWRLESSYSALRLTPSVNAASMDTAAGAFDGNAPRHQWQTRSTTRLGQRTQVQAAIYRVGALRRLEVPAYTRFDAHVEVALGDRLAVVAAGRNLLTESHEEFSGARSGVAHSAVPRSARLELRWRF